MSLKAAVTLTLLSSASALTSLRLRRELPATNGQLDITDTCDKYQTKEDCCAEVNCQFAAPDKCTTRNAPAENGECPGDRAADELGRRERHKRQFAMGQMIGSANWARTPPARVVAAARSASVRGTGEPSHSRLWCPGCRRTRP